MRCKTSAAAQWRNDDEIPQSTFYIYARIDRISLTRVWVSLDEIQRVINDPVPPVPARLSNHSERLKDHLTERLTGLTVPMHTWLRGFRSQAIWTPVATCRVRYSLLVGSFHHSAPIIPCSGSERLTWRCISGLLSLTCCNNCRLYIRSSMECASRIGER